MFDKDLIPIYHLQEIILYYFSAHWCPPCRQFTPMLKDFYGEIEDQNVEIVFVSSDRYFTHMNQSDQRWQLLMSSCPRSADDMLSYMKESHGDWLGVEHGSAVAQGLKEKYGISGIPTLIVVKADGTVITKVFISWVKMSIGANGMHYRMAELMLSASNQNKLSRHGRPNLKWVTSEEKEYYDCFYHLCLCEK